MRFTEIFRVILLSVFIATAVSCKDDIKPVNQETVEMETKMVLSVDKTSLETVDIRVRHDGTNDQNWVYISTADLETDADELIDAVIANELSLTNQILANTGNNKSIRISGLEPKSYYRLIVKFIDAKGTPVGKAQQIVFRTNRNLDVFEVNSNWNVSYDNRTQGVDPLSSELVEYDNFKCTSTDEEPYILAVIKKSDYDSFVKNTDHKLKIRTFFEEYIASSGVEVGSDKWAEIVEKGNCSWQEQRLRCGDWYLFMVGVDEKGELTGLYKQVQCLIPEEEATDAYNRWLGTWEVNAYDNMVPVKFTLTILKAEANMWYYSVGWEPNNIYGIDPASLPVELFFDKTTGKVYLVSQYVSSAVDMAGAVMDFYMYGVFPYGGASTFLDTMNTKIAEFTMTDNSNTEAKVTGMTFTTTQAGSLLSFQYKEAIYYMYTQGSTGSAISVSHPDFPYTMKKITE